jgi:CheY-like chemotaxis protein
LVEDDLSTLEFLERFLSEKGATVVPCSNGEMALENVRAGRPDIVISDIGMPDMDGYQLVKHLRTLPTEGTHLPIIAVTAFARPEDETRALQAGFDAHVAKPVDLEKLEHTVLSLLGGPDKAAA